MKSLTTRISLPAPLLTGETLRELLELLFQKYRWFSPTRYGFADLDSRLDPNHIDYAAIVAVYKELRTVTVAAKADRDFILLFSESPSDHPYTSGLTWVTPSGAAARKDWREKHLREVAELMRLLEAPLGVSALKTDFKDKTQRWVPNPIAGETLTFNVRGYGEGLPGLFWRNFFGPPFTRMFGDRLATLPSEFTQNLGDGIVLVQPYELPTEAGTPEAIARERQLISLLGPDCFYDHEHHRKPTRVPDLPPSPQ
jgi:hypothetical protein